MDTPNGTPATKQTISPKHARSSTSWKIQLGILCVMLILALGGMGLSQATEKGAWEYWLFVVIVYGVLGLWRSMRRARRKDNTARIPIERQIAHWGILVCALAVLLFLERREIVTRQSASDFATMMLALTCALAGVHFDWLFLPVAGVLTVMLVAMAMLEQDTILLWITMAITVLGAVAFFYFNSRKLKEEIAEEESLHAADATKP